MVERKKPKKIATMVHRRRSKESSGAGAAIGAIQVHHKAHLRRHVGEPLRRDRRLLKLWNQSVQDNDGIDWGVVMQNYESLRQELAGTEDSWLLDLRAIKAKFIADAPMTAPLWRRVGGEGEGTS